MSRNRTATALVLAGIASSPAGFAVPAHAGSPSFDCAKTDSRAEELICGDKELAVMDVEATRLFRLVRDRADRPEREKKALNEDRARWLKVRDECWISEDLRTCIIASYALRIHSLREKHAETRVSDEEGITRGPYEMRCKELKGTLKATFIRSDPPVSAVELPQSIHVGIGAGARYVERMDRGGLQFWTEGDEAFLKMPNGVSYSCVLDRD